MEPLCGPHHKNCRRRSDKWLAARDYRATALGAGDDFFCTERQVVDFVDIALPANAQAAAEALGLRVEYSITKGAWVRQIPRDEAEIAIECLRDWGIAARIREVTAGAQPEAASEAGRTR